MLITKKKLILGENPTQRLDDTTLLAEKKSIQLILQTVRKGSL